MFDWSSEIAKYSGLKKQVERFWALPKVEHGKAQMPYFYGTDGNGLLNQFPKQRQKLIQEFYIKTAP